MAKKISYAASFLCAVAATLSSEHTVAFPSYGAEDTYSEFVVTFEDGSRHNVTLLRDHEDRLRFYYLPVSARLATQVVRRNGADVVLPRYTLLRYQFADPDAPQKTLTGGFLQFVVRMGLTGEQIAELKAQILKGVTFDGEPPTADKLFISQTPIENAKVSVFDPKSGAYVGTGSPTGIGPTDLTQDVPFTLKLDQINSDMAEGLTGQGQGINLFFDYEYEALAPQRGFSVEIDWDKVFTYVSTDTATAERIREGWWIFSRDRETKKNTALDIKQALTNNDAMTVKSIGLTDDEEATLLQPILTQVQGALFSKDDVTVPDAIDPKIAADELPTIPDSALAGSVKATVEKKFDIKQTRTGKQKIDFERRPLLRIKSVSPGTISIADRPLEIREQLTPVISQGNWDQAYLLLPAVQSGAEGLIKQVALTAYPTDGVKDGDAQTLLWSGDGQGGGAWRDAQGTVRQSVLFPLLSWRERYRAANPGDPDGYKKKLDFKIKTLITTAHGQVFAEHAIPAFSGDQPIADTLAPFRTFKVTGRFLQFGREPAKLAVADISVRDPQTNAVIEAEFTKKEDVLVFLMAQQGEDPAAYELDVVLEYENEDVPGSLGGGTHEWSGSGKRHTGTLNIRESDCVDGNVLRTKCLTKSQAALPE